MEPEWWIGGISIVIGVVLAMTSRLWISGIMLAIGLSMIVRGMPIPMAIRWTLWGMIGGGALGFAAYSLFGGTGTAMAQNSPPASPASAATTTSQQESAAQSTGDAHPKAAPKTDSGPHVVQRIQQSNGTVIGSVNGNVTNNYGVQQAPQPHGKAVKPPAQDPPAMFNIHDSSNFEIRENLDIGPRRPMANVDHSRGFGATGNVAIGTSSQSAGCHAPALYSGSGFSNVLIQGSTVRWSCPPAPAKKTAKKPANTQAANPPLPAASAPL